MHSPRLLLLDHAPIPGSGDELRLYADGGHFSIKIASLKGGGGSELMSTRMHGSEDALAEVACTRIAARPGVRVLIGGLGMGFTLAAALARLGADARVTVAELVPAVVAWNRDALGAHAGHPLADPRVEVHEGDVGNLVRAGRAGWDAILLDVDNGPQGLTRRANDALYDEAGLAGAWRALRPGGVLAVWSAHPDRAFTERLRRCGFDVEEVPVRAHGGKGSRHRIWLATPTAVQSTPPRPRPRR